MAGFFSLLRRLYLTAYNFTLFVGWFQVLYIVLKTLKESGHESIYHAAEKPLLFAQTAAVLEIICSFFFGLKEAFGSAPSWLLWLRYSTFLVLYPTGISSEVGLIYIAFPFIKASEKYCIRMPNKWNFSFDYFCAANVVLGIYVPGLNSILTTNALCLIFLFLINLVSH
ncbi:Very-long-chain (3R)-3-hydroxyacyl-CoA dehydratase PASTICCINO 2A [Glycine soja]|nr:Very-long-chain (3R)-3-hydroxyacyl-CoA dehydratase PASTICCINO 2A [Glycine max]